MTREIKFRAWNKGLERMEKFEEIEIYETSKLSKALDCNIDYVLMQFTGLKDKNGKEIYEGDIVEYQSFFHKQARWYPCHRGLKVVEFRSFRNSYGWNIGISNPTKTRVEVKGNIYQNPELLK